MSVGRDLLDTPFAEMVLQLGLAVAKGQTAMDMNSITTAKELAATKMDVLTEIVDTISQEPATSGGMTYQQTKVTSEPIFAKDISLIQAGLFPTFYQFTDTTVEVKMAISMKSGKETSVGGSATVKVNAGVVAVSATVDAKYSNSYSYSAEGSSMLRTTLKPVPPPARLIPRTVTVNTLVQPPEVSFS